MRKYFTSPEIVIFFVTAGLQSLLVATVLIKRTYRDFPLFSAVCVFWLANNISLYIESFWLTPTIYAYVYFVGSFVIYALIAAVVWDEIYLNTYGPSRSLPRWIPFQVFIYGSGLWLALIATGLMLPGHQTNSLISILYAIHRIFIGGLAAALLVLIAYSLFKVHIHWRLHTLAIASGLCFYMTISVVAAYSRYLLPTANMAMVKNIAEIAYLLAVLGWTSTLWLKDPHSSTIDPNRFQEIMRQHKTTIASARSWGIRVGQVVSREGRN